VAFSAGNAHEEEFIAAAETFGIGGLAEQNKVGSVTLYHYPNKRFGESRQDILENMVTLRRLLAPATVFVPSTYDTHQDHAVICQEAQRAFKERITILGFEAPRNNSVFAPQFFVTLEERHLCRKVEAVQQYESQSDKPYMSGPYLMGLARVRGVQAGCEYAEAFQVIKWVL